MARRKNPRSMQKRAGSVLTTGLGTLAGATVALAGSWIVYSRVAIDHHVPLPPAVQADQEMFFSKAAGRLNYYADRRQAGRPLVLVHSVNAAASAYEMYPLFEYYRSQRPVFALDLPGYGFSERSQGPYSPHLFTEALREFLQTEVRQAADVVALSLSSEFAARAAVQMPDLFHSLIMISPTGLGPKREPGGRQPSPYTTVPFSYRAISFPLWGQALFDLLVTKASIQAFLAKNFVGPVSQDLVEYAYAASHQPGAMYAPFYFLSGVLFTPNVREQYYDLMSVPTLVLYDRDPYTGFEQLPDLVQNSEWIEAARVVNTLGLPHFEKLEATTMEMNRFWSSLNQGE